MRYLTLGAFLVVGFFLSSMSLAADVREDFLRIIDRPRVPLAASVTPLPSADGLLEFHFTYYAGADDIVPGILIKSANSTGRRPVVIALHGTGGTKNDEVALLRRLASAGFVAVAIDGPFHGERSKAGKGTVDYDAAILKAWRERQGHPFYFDTVWDIMRLIDYLQTCDDVDGNRIGLYGVSKGGIETYLTAAIDARVACAVPCIGMESFKWALDNDSWHSRIGTIQGAFDGAVKEASITSPDAKFVHEFYSRVCPGIDGEFDGPAMAPLIAPRPLMAINGDSDPRTPLPGLKLCTDAAAAAYHAAGADDRFVVRIQEKTGHKVNADSQTAAVDWFIKWLKP